MPIPRLPPAKFTRESEHRRRDGVRKGDLTSGRDRRHELDRGHNRTTEQKRRERGIVSEALCEGIAPGNNNKKQDHAATDHQGHGIVAPAARRLATGIWASAEADHNLNPPDMPPISALSHYPFLHESPQSD